MPRPISYAVFCLKKKPVACPSGTTARLISSPLFPSSAHQTLPAPGEYIGDVTEVAVNAIHVTLPENVVEGAVTVIPEGALIVTPEVAVMVTLPLLSSLT